VVLVNQRASLGSAVVLIHAVVAHALKNLPPKAPRHNLLVEDASAIDIGQLSLVRGAKPIVKVLHVGRLGDLGEHAVGNHGATAHNFLMYKPVGASSTTDVPRAQPRLVMLRRLRGVGGHEHVFVRKIDRFAVDVRSLDGFEIEMGELDYGFQLGGILGMDFLRAARAILDLGALTIEFAVPQAPP
jgi:hypothetical protein